MGRLSQISICGIIRRRPFVPAHPQAFRFFRSCSAAEAFGEFEELLLLLLLSLHAILDQFHEHAVCAEAPRFRHRADLRGNPRRGGGCSGGLICFPFSSHHYAPEWCDGRLRRAVARGRDPRLLPPLSTYVPERLMVNSRG